MEYLEDREGKWSIEDVISEGFSSKFAKSKSETPNFGFTQSAYWFRFGLHSRLKHRQKYYLEFYYAVIDRIDFFFEKPDGSYMQRTAGDTFPHGNKVMRHNHFVFPVMTEPGKIQRIYLRVQTEGSMQAPLKLWTPEALLDYEHNKQLIYGIFIGLLAVMMFYNLFIYIVIRDNSYLHYVGYICVGLIYDGSFLGLAQEYLWPTLPWLANKALILSMYATNLFVYLFAKTFLNLKRDLPRWNRVFTVLAGLAATGLLLSLVLPYTMMIFFVPVLSIVGSAACISVAVISWRRGFRPARYYLAAWTAFFVGIVFFASNKLGIVPHNLLTESTHQLGFALNIVLLSFALADRINTMKADKEQAQAEALLIQQRAAENLEHEVERKTLDLKQTTKEAIEAKEELADAYERLTEHDRLKSRFFANVSHELRTPLTLILTPLQKLLASRDETRLSAVKDQLRSMTRNTHRLLRLVNQLLDFSRIESGAATVSFERSDIRSLVAQCVQGFESFALIKGLKLELRGPDELPEAYVDPGKLEKVVANLLSNACKFTEPGGTVLVRLTSDDDSVRIAIQDTGIGIAHQDLPKIFERFHQVDGSASRLYEGTGIGLALSKELVELTGGRLEVESDLGVGSTFSVYVPLGKEHIQRAELLRSQPGESDDMSRAEAAAEALAAEVGLRGQTTRDAQPEASSSSSREADDDDRPLLVVVEDNPDMLALVSEICQTGFRVLEANDGQQGLELIKEHKPCLVIADIMMPGIDGYELLRRVRTDPATASIPVILLTARAGPEMRLEGLESGADDYLTKPFDSRELLARARNLVRLQQQERQLRELNANLQQEVVRQSSDLERARMLERYLPPAVARLVLEGREPLAVGQQRRRLTVFQLELRGFDEMVQRIEPIVEPEDIAAMLNTYLSEMVDVAFAHGATVDRLMRDTIVGFFGAPTSESPEQDARRCARMAVEMWQRAFEVSGRWNDLLEEAHPPIPTMVLASGAATVGSFGSSRRLEYTAVGGPMDEAGLLLPSVRRGEVCCSQTTWLLIQGEVFAELCNEVKVRHQERPMKLYRIAGPPEWVASLPAESFLSVQVEKATRDAPSNLRTRVSPKPPHGSSDRSKISTDRLKTGTVFADRYEILKVLGKGGTGTVYRVRDLKVDTEVALKMIRDEFDSDTRRRERFYREVKLTRLVSHANVARIYELGEWQGHEFITMEYIQGHTLRRQLRTQGALTLADGRRVLLQLCAGLGAAHAASIVHRDLKPSNIMLRPDDRVVILDFGIARWLSTMHQTGEATRGPIGTPHYMAPEQFKSGKVDQRADIYSLGVVVFEMFTGRKPFAGEGIGNLAQMHLQEPPPNPLQLKPDLPPRLAAVILRCLEKSPQNRFRSVTEITNMLEAGEAEAVLR